MDARKFMEWFSRSVEPLKNRIMLMITRGVLTKTDDSKSIQTQKIKGLAGEIKNKVPAIQQYGFRSHTPSGGDVVMLSVNGNRENSVIISTEHRDFKPLTLNEGDAIFYNKNGKIIHLNGDNIEALCSKLKIENDSEELVTVMSDFMQEVLDSLNETALGPLPLTPATKAKIQAVKDRLDTFKV